jgi:hypothetical protein
MRISRRVALGGAAGAALLAGSALAQNTTPTSRAAPSVPAPEDAPAGEGRGVPMFEDVLIERRLGAGMAVVADPAIAPLPPFDLKVGPLRGGVPWFSVDGLKEQLASAKADRDFANGKMELGQVNALLTSAESLIGQAEQKQPTPTVDTPQPGVVIRKVGPLALSREARLAAAQISAAVALMEAALGGVLPSDARRVSQELTFAHRLIAETTAVTKGSSEASGLATQAQALYKQAYDAYQSGHYDQAAAQARAGIATAEAARLTVEPTPPSPSATPSAPPPPTF